MKISVVIPTYNRPDFLREALSSVANQDRKPDEVVVSDNHSTVSADHVIRDFESIFMVRKVSPPSPLPMDQHWIWAIHQASGDYTAFLEDDNLWRRNHLAALEAAVSKYPAASLAGTATIPFSDPQQEEAIQKDTFAPPWKFNLLTEEPVGTSREEVLGTYLFCTPFASSAVMVSNAVFRKVDPKGDGSKYGRDRWLWAQIATMGGAAYNPKVTVLYREHGAQTVKTLQRGIYRKESAKNTRLIIELANSHGVSLSKAVSSLEGLITSKTARFFANVTVRTRNWHHIRTLVPLLPGKPSCRQAIFEVIRTRFLG